MFGIHKDRPKKPKTLPFQEFSETVAMLASIGVHARVRYSDLSWHEGKLHTPRPEKDAPRDNLPYFNNSEGDFRVCERTGILMRPFNIDAFEVLDLSEVDKHFRSYVRPAVGRVLMLDPRDRADASKLAFPQQSHTVQPKPQVDKNKQAEQRVQQTVPNQDMRVDSPSRRVKEGPRVDF